MDETTRLLVGDPPKFLVNRFDGPTPSDVSQVWIDNEAKPKQLKFATFIFQAGRGLHYRPYSTRPTTIRVGYFETGLQRRRNEKGHIPSSPPFVKELPFWPAKFIPSWSTVQDYAVLFRIDPAAPVQIRHSPGRWKNGVAEVGYVLMPLKPGFGAWLAHIGLDFCIQPPQKDQLSFTITAQLYYKKSDTNYVRVVEHKSKPHCWELECNPWKPNLKKQRT